jgi:DNA-binding LacI/PurR family transcriptional regulator
MIAKSPSKQPKSAPKPKSPLRLTLNDVALATGVSRSTVSNAFGRPDQLSASLRETIVSKAREMGYFGPDMVARSMRRRELREVAVVFHHDLSFAMRDPASIEFLGGIAKELDARHLALQIIPKMGRKLMLDAAFQTLADVLIVHADIDTEFIPEVQSISKPLVLVDSAVPKVASVRIDDQLGARLAMHHALKSRPDVVVVLSFWIPDDERQKILQHRRAKRFGYVGVERTKGYGEVLAAQGFPLDRVHWINIDDQSTEASTQSCLAQLRASLPKGARLAVLGMSDRMALAAQKVLASWSNVTVTSIVGFDDIPAASAAGLTTIRQDHFHKGELAVRAAIDGVKPGMLPVSLVVRQT